MPRIRSHAWCGWAASLAVLTSLPAAADHAALGLGGSVGSPINTESALTLPAGRWSAGWRSEYVNQGRFSDHRLEDTELHSTDALWVNTLVLAYGVSDDFTLALRLPHVQRFNAREAEHHHHVPDAGDHDEHEAPEETHHGGEILDLGDPDGLGDATLFGEYRFFRSADQRSHLALLAGIKAPTGETGRRGGGRAWKPNCNRARAPGTACWVWPQRTSRGRCRGTPACSIPSSIRARRAPIWAMSSATTWRRPIAWVATARRAPMIWSRRTTGIW